MQVVVGNGSVMFVLSKPASKSDSLIVVRTVGNTLSRVQVDSVVCLSMVFSNVIVDITISSRSFVFSQSDVQISAGLTNIIVLKLLYRCASVSIAEWLL